MDPVFAAWIFLHFLSMFLTALRLGWRLKIKKQSWDDLWMVFAFIFSAIIATMYIALGTNPLPTYPRTTQNYFMVMSNLATPIAAWTGRIAMIVTIILALPRIVKAHWWISLFSFFLFVASWLAVTFSKLFQCGTPVPWGISCEEPKDTLVVTLVFNLIGTVWLALWPSIMLFHLRFSKAHRNLMITCAAVGLALTAVDIAHSVNLVKAKRDGPMVHYKALNATGNLIVIVSLLGANILALITYFYPLNLETAVVGVQAWSSKKNLNDSASDVESTHKTPEAAV